MSKIKVGDLIGINPNQNTHGCRDYAVAKYIGDGKAEIIEVQSCTSCHQVGHDYDHVFTQLGGVWEIKNAEPAGHGWSKDIKWEI